MVAPNKPADKPDDRIDAAIAASVEAHRCTARAAQRTRSGWKPSAQGPSEVHATLAARGIVASKARIGRRLGALLAAERDRMDLPTWIDEASAALDALDELGGRFYGDHTTDPPTQRFKGAIGELRRVFQAWALDRARRDGDEPSFHRLMPFRSSGELGKYFYPTERAAKLAPIRPARTPIEAMVDRACGRNGEGDRE